MQEVYRNADSMRSRSAWEDEKMIKSIQGWLQAKDHTLGTVKRTGCLGIRAEKRGKTSEMGETTAWSVADTWRVLMLLTSIELEYHKTALKSSFVLVH